MNVDRETLLAAAGEAARRAYAPYSRFRVGAALAFEDGAVVTGANVENASYGLSLCAEAVAVASAMADGRRGGLVALAVTGAGEGADGFGPVTPCGRCRQLLAELASLDGSDPLVWCDGADETVEMRLSALLPHGFAGRDPAG